MIGKKRYHFHSIQCKNTESDQPLFSKAHFDDVWSRACNLPMYRTNTMNCAPLSISVVSSSCKLYFLLRFAEAIVCCKTSCESSWIHRLMMSFDKGTIANVLGTAPPHIILAISTAAGLIKLSPAVWGAFARAIFQATEKEVRTALSWE